MNIKNWFLTINCRLLDINIFSEFGMDETELGTFQVHGLGEGERAEYIVELGEFETEDEAVEYLRKILKQLWDYQGTYLKSHTDCTGCTNE